MLGPSRARETEVLPVVIRSRNEIGGAKSKSLHGLLVDTHIMGDTREIRGAGLSDMA